eukprot:CAMPEP_0202962420 /NCGR_PEP_ID=MMETSP1396-20130829/6526_1 /ASSEMBLY_ACC=CAM_ASM_000872 /TAXON_ID= /ORGANISM="Pseudokeronopsis sp., Strain Brazil" /LENGTH=97 /DNA_ID=CAMNT_0049682987 /DNA_START=378 /DNA_END=669 /DNA_ORIENTATION=+
MNKMNVSQQMSAFEKVFEDLDVKTEDITGMLDQVVGSSADQSEVNNLLNQMMAEQGIDVGANMVGAGKQQVAMQNQAQANNEFDDSKGNLTCSKESD